jgi:hypothetical protein
MQSAPSPPPARGTVAAASVCGIVVGLLRLALAVALVLALAAGAAELSLRAGGVKPHRAAELSNVVPDAWTAFRLRPDVGGQEAYVTNDLGMHAPRSYAPAPPPGTLRVAVLGSSVVYGLDVGFADTIPAAVERELRAAGRPAEALNFGTHAFNIVHVSALLQAYVHQLRPHVVVVVVDIQVGMPIWPEVRPRAEPTGGIKKLGWGQALLVRGSGRSALLGLLVDPRPARRWIRRTTGLPLRPRPHPTPRPVRAPRAPAPAAARTPDAVITPLPPEQTRAYEERRERELAAPLSAMAAFAAEHSIELYFVTPYGPYFDPTDDELSRMSVHHLLEEATRVYGSERAALAAEVTLITRVVRRVARGRPPRVIDMLEASRSSSVRTSPHFTQDGVHLSPAGNAALGKLIAARILRDLDERRRDPS